jgi:hypothetical protein
MSSPLAEQLRAGLPPLLTLPRAEQPAAVRALLATLPKPAGEAWNSTFGPGSLFEAFTRSSIAQGVYAANRAVLRPLLDARPGFRVIEVGGGSGALWAGLLRPDDAGEIVVVDPHPDGAAGVRGVAPAGVTVTHLPAPIQEVELPPADAAVASLVLHHVAGFDASARARVHLPGNGKREALEALRRAIHPRGGTLVVNEADIYCDLSLPPGDPLLAERLVDSYVRRFACSLLADLEGPDQGCHDRWAAIVRDWALAQVGLCDARWADRDVYERDVPAWLRLFEAAGLRVRTRGFTDRWMLFHQYVLEAA